MTPWLCPLCLTILLGLWVQEKEGGKRKSRETEKSRHGAKVVPARDVFDVDPRREALWSRIAARAYLGMGHVEVRKEGWRGGVDIGRERLNSTVLGTSPASHAPQRQALTTPPVMRTPPLSLHPQAAVEALVMGLSALGAVIQAPRRSSFVRFLHGCLFPGRKWDALRVVVTPHRPLSQATPAIRDLEDVVEAAEVSG